MHQSPPSKQPFMKPTRALIPIADRWNGPAAVPLFVALSSVAGCGSVPDDGVATVDQALTVEAAPSRTRFTVDRATDGTDGVCQANRPSHGTCNLRAAVAAALASPRPGGITLARA